MKIKNNITLLAIGLAFFVNSCMTGNNLEDGEFEFYGVGISIGMNDSIQTLDLVTSDIKDASKLSFAVERTLLELQNYGINETINELIEEAEDIDLDDFGYRLLLEKFTEAVFEKQSQSFKEVVIWYGLEQNDLESMMFVKDKEILTLVSSDEILIGGVITCNGRSYYPGNRKENFDGYRVQVLDIKGEENKRPLHFESKLPKLGDRIEETQKNFTFEEEEYILPISYNKNLVDYFNDLPSRKPGRYLIEMEPSEEAQESFEENIPQWLENKTPEKKLAFLLKLVAYGFPYKADLIERSNFVEQSLDAEFTDCEDRAVLFDYLAEKYLGVDVLLVARNGTSSDPGHVSGAIKLEPEIKITNPNAYKFTYQGETYLICDPSVLGGIGPGETVFTLEQLKTEVSYY